jgi:hypothetical protein
METKTLSQKGMGWIKKHPIISIIGVIFIIGLIGSTIDPVEKKPDQLNVQKQEVAQPVTFEDKVKSIITTARSTDLTFKGIETKNTDSDRPAGSQMITISLNVDNYYKAEYLSKNTSEISSKLFQETFVSNPNVYDVIVWYYADITDKYGNKENKVLISQAIDKTTFEKINWQNFDTTKLCDFLKSEGSLNDGQSTCVTLAKIQ